MIHKPQTVVNKLNKLFPDIRGIKVYKDTGIWLGDAAEGGTIDGSPAADYYGDFHGGYPWRHPKLERALDSMGYFIEWHDPGSLTAWQK